MDTPHRLPVLAIIVTSLVAASGCSSQAERYTDLTEDEASAEPLPDSLREDAFDGLDLESTRWVGEHDGADLWLGMRAEDAGACLVMDPGDERWVTGCSSGHEVNLSNGGAWEYHVRPDGFDPPEEAIEVSHNVFVTDR